MPAPWETADPASSWGEFLAWLHRFCENWLFAFIVAMAIRHFCLEAFRIPTASMEPMLYGDPGWFKGDNVVVDKLWSRFAGVQRWDVTVFQFPLPEVESSLGDRARPAITAGGDRLDRLFLRPLMYSNFVKRTVVLPGDTFYFAGGDLFLKQGEGFALAVKPDRVQDALWMPVYAAGAQPGHLPWSATAGSAVALAGRDLALTLAPGGEVAFTQPFNNLYLKPGTVRVIPRGEGGQGELVQASMTQPLFEYRGRQGSIWDLDRWQLFRLTSADLDSRSHGRFMNAVMDEWVGDLRLDVVAKEVTGEARLALHLGQAQELALALSGGGWRLERDGEVLAHGAEPVQGRRFRLIRCDGRTRLIVDGQERFAGAVPWIDPNRHRPGLRVTGSGRAVLGDLAIARDVHYTSRGFLANEAGEAERMRRKRQQADRLAAGAQLQREREPGFTDQDWAEVATLARGGEIADGVARQARLLEDVRLSLGAEGRAVQARAALAVSPETAVTAPPGAYLLLGDNSPFSWDGRNWGWVPEENIRGEALAVFFPPWRWRVVR